VKRASTALVHKQLSHPTVDLQPKQLAEESDWSILRPTAYGVYI